MNPKRNPYAPGAGTPPPELAGRAAVLEGAEIALDRVRNGLAAKSVLLVGLRGVGKTVLLDRIGREAEARGLFTVSIEAREGLSLPNMLAPPLQTALHKMSGRGKAAAAVRRALRALKSFTLSAKVTGVEVAASAEFQPEPGIADSGDLGGDLGDLLQAVGLAAKAQKNALALLVDELQYVKKPELAALIVALHQCARRELPLALVGAGLPQLVARCGDAKSYAERMFEFREIGALNCAAAKQALRKPARQFGVTYAPAALEKIVQRTGGYPYFLQEWGKHCWECAAKSPITLADVRRAGRAAKAALDASFFRVRFDQLTPLERRYLRAMAQVSGPGPRRTGAIAEALGAAAQGAAPTRAKLIEKGMIYSTAYGEVAFTVPLFDDYLHRVLPAE